MPAGVSHIVLKKLAKFTPIRRAGEMDVLLTVDQE